MPPKHITTLRNHYKISVWAGKLTKLFVSCHFMITFSRTGFRPRIRNLGTQSSNLCYEPFYEHFLIKLRYFTSCIDNLRALFIKKHFARLLDNFRQLCIENKDYDTIRTFILVTPSPSIYSFNFFVEVAARIQQSEDGKFDTALIE